MTVNEFMEKAEMQIDDGWIIAALTDKYVVDKWPDQKGSIDGKDGKILELRVFNKAGEMKFSRSDIGGNFLYRSIFDEGDTVDTREHYDEIQYLDIDEKEGRNADGKVRTTGGGLYYLPLEKINNAGIKIRYYLGKYKETGHARVEDWRLVEFVEGR